MKKSISCTERPWVAIRRCKTTGMEFIDMTLIDKNAVLIFDKIEERRLDCEAWDKDNPVIRVSSCVLTENQGENK